MKGNSRDPQRTRQKILDAATEEFARYGLGGARVDRIAARAGANKRMLYYYFRDKDNLFLAALEGRYAHIRAAERSLDLEHLEPRRALKRLVEFTWDYFLEHPEFMTLLNVSTSGVCISGTLRERRTWRPLCRFSLFSSVMNSGCSRK